MPNSSNRDISQKLEMPLRSVQRRTKKLFQSGIVENKVELNFRQVGLRTGLLHIYLQEEDVYSVANKIKDIEGI